MRILPKKIIFQSSFKRYKRNFFRISGEGPGPLLATPQYDHSLYFPQSPFFQHYWVISLLKFSKGGNKTKLYKKVPSFEVTRKIFGVLPILIFNWTQFWVQLTRPNFGKIGSWFNLWYFSVWGPPSVTTSATVADSSGRL